MRFLDALTEHVERANRPCTPKYLFLPESEALGPKFVITDEPTGTDMEFVRMYCTRIIRLADMHAFVARGPDKWSPVSPNFLQPDVKSLEVGVLLPPEFRIHVHPSVVG